MVWTDSDERYEIWFPSEETLKEVWEVDAVEFCEHKLSTENIDEVDDEAEDEIEVEYG